MVAAARHKSCFGAYPRYQLKSGYTTIDCANVPDQQPSSEVADLNLRINLNPRHQLQTKLLSDAEAAQFGIAMGGLRVLTSRRSHIVTGPRAHFSNNYQLNAMLTIYSAAPQFSARLLIHRRTAVEGLAVRKRECLSPYNAVSA